MTTISKYFDTVKKPSLYTLNTNLREALESVHIDEETGEIIGLDAVRDLGQETKSKVADCARFLQEAEMLLDGMKKAKTALDERIREKERVIKSIKSMVEFTMKNLNTQKIEEEDICVSLRRTAGSITIVDESLLPIDVWREKIERTVDKTEIKRRIKAGIEVQGAIFETGFSVQIK